MIKGQQELQPLPFFSFRRSTEVTLCSSYDSFDIKLKILKVLNFVTKTNYFWGYQKSQRMFRDETAKIGVKMVDKFCLRFLRKY